MYRLRFTTRLLSNATRFNTPIKSLTLNNNHARRCYSDHAESYEEFTSRYQQFFDKVDDPFELQRGLNNCFSYDIVPAPSVIESALRAARRVDDYSTAVRIFEGLKDKVESESQYQEYLAEFKSLRSELSVDTKEELGI